MITPFTYEEGSILVRLIIAHCLADFFLQSNKAVEDKERKGWKSKYLWIHILIVILSSSTLLFNLLSWKQIIVIAVTHLIIDAGKIEALKKYNKSKAAILNLWLFILDQILHIAVLIVVWLWMIEGWEEIRYWVASVFPNYRYLLRLLGYIIVVGPVGYLIRFLTDKWATDLDKSDDGLQDAGMWIGILERTLIITLVFIEQFTAIGFLVAAKSILRLIDKPEPSKVSLEEQAFSSRKHTEYVVIGTFLSFSFALITGLIINFLLKL
jgi:hypothetical protein